MREQTKEGENIFKQFFNVVFKKMATESRNFAIQILKRQGKWETDEDFKESFQFLLKDIMNEKVNALEEMIIVWFCIF